MLTYHDSLPTLAGMAAPCVRTTEDDIADVLAHLDQAQRLLRDWREHLVAQQADPSEHRRWLVERVKGKAVDTVIDAGALTQRACEQITGGISLDTYAADDQRCPLGQRL
jgi:hypothetical protein